VWEILHGVSVVASMGAVLAWSRWRWPEIPAFLSGFGSMLIVLAWVAGRLWHERAARAAMRGISGPPG